MSPSTMSSLSSTSGKNSGRSRPVLTACEACRKLKMRCIRQQSTNDGDASAAEPCERCRRNKRACTTPEARPLGRRHGATGRYHGLEKAYRRMQAELKKAQRNGGPATIEALQGLPDVADVVHVPEFTEMTEPTEISEVTEIPDIPEIPDVPDIDVQDTPGVPEVLTQPEGQQPASIAVIETDFESPAPPNPEPDPEPMSNPLALLADASSDAAQAFECGSVASVAMMTSPQSCTSVSSGEATINGVNVVNAGNGVNVGRRLLRRPGYVSLGLRLSRDTLEHGLDALFAPTPTAHPHANYFKLPSWAPLRDVGPDVDPVDLGLVTMEEAAALFPIYFARLHPINGILDPVLHTPAFVRARSALLFTWILALTAQFDHGSAAIAKRLRLHGEKLSNHVHACGFKSVEIIQGYYISLLSANPAATLAEERSWLYTMYAFGLGSELGLDARARAGAAGPDQTGPDNTGDGSAGSANVAYAARLARNRERTWLRILLWERANSAARGRMHSFPETALTRNVERWWRHPLADAADKHTCAFILLRRTLAAVQRELHRQASVSHAHDPHWVRNLVETTLRPWREEWLSQGCADASSSDDNGCAGSASLSLTDTYLLHVYLHGRLWTLSFALHRSISSDGVQLAAIRQDCFEAAVHCCEAAVRDLQALGEPLYCMLAPTWAMISYAAVLALSLFQALYGGDCGDSRSADGNIADGRDAELLALVSLVALQLERAGTTPSHRYGIAALLGRHLVSILRTRALSRGDQGQTGQPAQQQTADQQTLSQALQSQPQPLMPQHTYHQPYPQPDVCASDVDGWPDTIAYHDGTTSLHEYAPSAPFALSALSALSAPSLSSMADPSVAVYNPFWTTAVMSTEGDLTGEGFADLLRDMFRPGIGGVF